MDLHDDRITVGGMERQRLLLPRPLIWAVFFTLGYVVYDDSRVGPNFTSTYLWL